MTQPMEHDPNQPKLGDIATCRDCHRSIQWVGRFWEHVETNPRHRGVPERLADSIEKHNAANSVFLNMTPKADLGSIYNLIGTG